MSNAWAMLPIPVSAITTNGNAAGFDPATMASDHMGVVWKSVGGASSVSIVIDCGVPQKIDTALFFGCTAASPGWTLLVQSADNSAFTLNATVHASGIPFLAGANFPTHGRGVGYWTNATVPAARRYWRFVISGLANAQVTIARIAIGQRITLARNFAYGAAAGVKDLGKVDWARNGVRIRTRGAKLRTLALTFPNVYRDEIENKVQPLVEMAAGQEPIVICTDPDVSAMRQRRCYIGHLIGDLGNIQRTAIGWEWRAALVDLVPVQPGNVSAGTPSFDFSGAALPSGATLTRASTGTYFNAAGVLSTAAIDVARFEYYAGVLRGLLIEPAATNLLVNSEVWTGSSSTTSNNLAAPDGNMTADTCVLSGTQTQRFLTPVGSFQNQTVTFSAFIWSTTLLNNTLLANLYEGGLSSQTANTIPANAWTRISTTRAFGSGTDLRAWLQVVAGATIGIWGGQVEVGATPSSYIPTTAATAARSADVLTLNWASVGLSDGLWTIRYAFDDGTTQDVATTVASGVSTVPTNLNRRWLRSAEKV